MTDVANAVIVVGVFVVLIALRWSFRAANYRFAESHPWVGIVAAFGLVIWAVLDALGVVHESPYHMWKTYIYGGISAVVLIVLGLGVRAKPR
jgi:predicted tellurium resistance membrane protein TerC